MIEFLRKHVVAITVSVWVAGALGWLVQRATGARGTTELMIAILTIVAAIVPLLLLGVGVPNGRATPPRPSSSAPPINDESRE